MSLSEQDKKLLEASMNGDLEGAWCALHRGANKNAKDNNGDTPLHWASKKRKETVVELLLEKGADPSTTNDKGDTPLQLAREYSNPKCADTIQSFLERQNKVRQRLEHIRKEETNVEQTREQELWVQQEKQETERFRREDISRKQLLERAREHRALVGSRLMQGEELQEFCEKNGMCPLCAQIRVKRKKNGAFGRSWTDIEIELDARGDILIYKGYHISPQCYSLGQAKAELGENVGNALNDSLKIPRKMDDTHSAYQQDETCTPDLTGSESVPRQNSSSSNNRPHRGGGSPNHHTTLVGSRGAVEMQAMATSTDRNAITVLYSEPLVYKDTHSNLRTFEKLDFQIERAVLNQCLKEASPGIELFFDSATRHRLLAAKTLRPTCLHYSGHGLAAHLPFENGKGAPHWLDSRVLHNLILRENGQPFKFVFVSACHSRKAGEVFVAAGVPHVVCCEQESEIKDAVARDFAYQFYLALASGHTVKYSFQQGCQAVLATPNLENAEGETEKFLLLPEDGDHEVSIFDWREGQEWAPMMRLPELQVYNLIQRKLSCRPPQPYVGREIDMYHVLNLVLAKQLVSVVGEKGIGRKSLVYAVCHYINERRSTMLMTIDSILFVKSARKLVSNGFFHALKKLERQLILAERGIVHDLSDDMDSLIDSVCDLISDEALLVIDGTDYVRGSEEQEDLVNFLSSLRETRGTKVLLIGLEPLQNPSVPEQDYTLSPLDLYSTIRLFCNLCPRLDTPAKRKVYRERLVTAVGEWSDQGDAARMELLYQVLGRGVPGKTVEKAGQSSSLSEIDVMLSDRAPRPMLMEAEEDLTHHGMQGAQGESFTSTQQTWASERCKEATGRKC